MVASIRCACSVWQNKPMTNSDFSRGMDAARVGACFMVVLLHVAAVDFLIIENQHLIRAFYDAFTRSSVPVFFMVSGALLLNKNELLSVFFRKRMVRIVPPLIFWSAFYFIWNTRNGVAYGSPSVWLSAWLSGGISFHLWYLYAITGIYLFIPFLRHVWQASSQPEKNLFLGAWLLVSAWPIVQKRLNIDIDIIDTWQLGTFFGYFGYFFLGAYLHQKLTTVRLDTRRPAWRVVLLSVSLFVFFSLLTLWASHSYSQSVGQPDSLFLDYLSPLVVAASVCVFFLFTRAGAALKHQATVLKTMAACTLGVYCAHMFVLDVVRISVGWPITGPALWWSIPATAVLVFTSSMAMVLGLRRLYFGRLFT